jgi:hypothetical protein
MSHERGPGVSGGDRTPTVSDPGVLALLKRHLVEWPRRYVEMRVGAIDDRDE